MCVAMYIACTASCNWSFGRVTGLCVLTRLVDTGYQHQYIAFRAALDCTLVGPPVGAGQVGLVCGRMQVIVEN